MRHCLLLLFFALSFCFTSDVEARKLALLIGVDNYEYIQSLNCCVNDMKALKGALINVGFAEADIYLLTSDSSVNYPSKDNIEEMVAKILKVSAPKDLVFFALSGHGVREGETDYFCPPSANPRNIEGTCVSITKVMDDLSKSKAQFKWMVVDACRSNAGNARDVRAFQIISKAPENIALLQSCNKGQKSYEESRVGGNGYFTKNLVAALSGEAANMDGKLTVLDVCNWTSSHTETEVRLKEHQTQTPFLSYSGTGYVLFIDPKGAKANKKIEEARKAKMAKKYSDAVNLYNEAFGLCPRLATTIRNERDSAKRLWEEQNRNNVMEYHDLSLIGKIEGERNTVSVNGISVSFRWCPPGMYTMGSPIGEPGKDDLTEELNLEFDKNEKLHTVKLTKGFWMMETEVTVGLFKAFVSDTGYVSTGSKPFGSEDNGWERDSKYSWRNPGFDQDDSHPVTCVSWNDAVAFCKWLSKKTGQKIQLPTEAQWEYACRAGSTTALPNGPIEIKGANNAPALDPISWYGGNSSQGFIGYSGMDSRDWAETQYAGGLCGTHQVRGKDSNSWGIFDMIGNVWEWCADWYGDYPDGNVTDPTGPTSGSRRVCRGGSWLSDAKFCRSAFRYGITPGRRIGALGFRCVAIPSRW